MNGVIVLADLFEGVANTGLIGEEFDILVADLRIGQRSYFNLLSRSTESVRRINVVSVVHIVQTDDRPVAGVVVLLRSVVVRLLKLDRLADSVERIEGIVALHKHLVALKVHSVNVPNIILGDHVLLRARPKHELCVGVFFIAAGECEDIAGLQFVCGLARRGDKGHSRVQTDLEQRGFCLVLVGRVVKRGNNNAVHAVGDQPADVKGRREAFACNIRREGRGIQDLIFVVCQIDRLQILLVRGGNGERLRFGVEDNALDHGSRVVNGHVEAPNILEEGAVRSFIMGIGQDRVKLHMSHRAGGNIIAVRIGAVPHKAAGGEPVLSVLVINSLRQILGIIDMVDLAGLCVGNSHDKVSCVTELIRLQIERIGIVIGAVGLRRGEGDMRLDEGFIIQNIAAEVIEELLCARLQGVAHTRGSVVVEAIPCGYAIIGIGISGLIHYGSIHKVIRIKVVAEVSLLQDGSLRPVAVEGKEGRMAGGDDLVGLGIHLIEEDKALDIGAVFKHRIEIRLDRIVQHDADRHGDGLARGNIKFRNLFAVYGVGDLCVIVLTAVAVDEIGGQGIDIDGIIFFAGVCNIVHQDIGVQVIVVRVAFAVVCEGDIENIFAGLLGIIAQLLERVSDVSGGPECLDGIPRVAEARALLADGVGIIILIMQNPCGAFQQRLRTLRTLRLAQLGIVLRKIGQHVGEGAGHIRSCHRSAAVNIVIAVARVHGGIDSAAEGGHCRVDRQHRGGAPVGEVAHQTAIRIGYRFHFFRCHNYGSLSTQERLRSILLHGDRGDRKRVDRHGDHARLIVDDDAADGAGCRSVVDLLLEGDLAALHDRNLAGHISRRKILGVAQCNAALAVGNNDKLGLRICESIEPKPVIRGVDVGEALLADSDHIGGIGNIFQGGNRSIAFIGGGAGNRTVVGILRSDVACERGILRHGVLVAGSDAEDNACLVQTVVDVAEYLSLQLGIIGKAVLRADGHVDNIRAETVSVFQSVEVNVGGGARLFIMEDLHRKELRCGRSAAEGNRTFLRIRCITGGNAGNMGAVTVVIGDIRVLIGIVVSKRNLRVDVHTGSDCQLNILLGQNAGLCADAERILERLVGGEQTGIKNRDHHARAAVAAGHCLIITGEVIGNCDLLVGGFQLRCGIAIGNVDRLNAVDVRDLVQIAVSDIAGEAVEQRGEFVGDLVVDTAHRLADCIVLTLERCAALGCLCAALFSNVCLGLAFQYDNCTDDLVVSVLISIFCGKRRALEALEFLFDRFGLRVLLDELLNGGLSRNARAVGLRSKRCADAGNDHHKSKQHRKHTLELFHCFVSFSKKFEILRGFHRLSRNSEKYIIIPMNILANFIENGNKKLAENLP